MASLQSARPSSAGPLFDPDAPDDDAPRLTPSPYSTQTTGDTGEYHTAATRPAWELPAEHLPIEQGFRHAWWAKRRRRTYDALNAAGVSSRRLVNFQHCGTMAQVEVEQKTGAVRVTSVKCHDRMCQACGEERGRQIAQALEAKCLQQKTLHVVLTLRSTDDDLSACIDRLFAGFRKLRKHPFWVDHATGGASAFECTWNKDTGQWHPHLHVLVHADYLDQRRLRAAWLEVTGDSHVCNVSLVGAGHAAAREVTKYIGKPIHRSVDGDEALTVELIGCLKGRRLITTFGSWRGTPLTTYCKALDTNVWRPVCTLITLHDRAAAGDVWSIQTLRYLHSRRPGRIHEPAPTCPPPPPPAATPPGPSG